MFFEMNGDIWEVIFVNSFDQKLVDRTGEFKLGVTDPLTMLVSISDSLSPEMTSRVLIHELGHCAMISYNLLDHIHMMVKPQYWIEAEEFICNIIADYGQKIFDTSYKVLDAKTLQDVSYELEHVIRWR